MGLDWIGLALMEAGTRWILGVAHWVGGLDGAVRAVPSPPALALPVLALGLLWLILWPGRARLAGIAVAVLSLVSWGLVERPALLIAETGALVGIIGEEGRALTRARGEGFVARNWLEADGDAADQAQAASRLEAAAETPPRFSFAGKEWVHLFGRQAPRLLEEFCRPGAVVVVDYRLGGPVQGGCQVIDARALSATGARAASVRGGEIRWRHAHVLAGDRPWTRAR